MEKRAAVDGWAVQPGRELAWDRKSKAEYGSGQSSLVREDAG